MARELVHDIRRKLTDNITSVCASQEAPIEVIVNKNVCYLLMANSRKRRKSCAVGVFQAFTSIYCALRL